MCFLIEQNAVGLINVFVKGSLFPKALFIMHQWLQSAYHNLGGIREEQKNKVLYLVTVFTDAHKKIVRFDVSMNEILVVEIFNATYHLEMKNKMNEKSLGKGIKFKA